MKRILSITLVLFSHFCLAQSDYERIVEYYNELRSFNGVVLVANKGSIEYLNGVGVSNRQSGTTINSKSKFKIASITKTFTAVLILQLYEQGKIDLKIPFGKYYPSYKGEAKDKVTIENLLTYSSQIPNRAEESNSLSYQTVVTLDDFIDKYCSDKLVGVPGRESNYGNTEYIILHKIIENVTKKPYEIVLQENILGPLNMENTNMLRATDLVTGLVSSYTIDDSTKSIRCDQPYFIENYFGSGAMYSTVEDLLKFDVAIYNFQLLNKANTELMIRPNKELGNVAFGVWYSDGYNTIDEPFTYRTGGIQGACSNWIHTLNTNKCIILLSNTNGTNLFEMSEQLYLVSSGKKPTIPLLTEPIVNSTENLDNVKGTWLVDLRPDPKSEAYYREFIIEPIEGKEFKGVFYGSKFTGGYFNTDWEKVIFAFTTGDKDNTYFHSGYIVGDRIYGISFCEGRRFTSQWTGIRK